MNNKYKLLLLSISILLIVTLFLGMSYAFYGYSDELSNSSTASSGCFEITFEDIDDINLQSTYPLNDDDLFDLTPYKFNITNICKGEADYEVAMEMLEGTTMDLNAIRYLINDINSEYNSSPRILGKQKELNSSTYINDDVIKSHVLEFGTLKENESITYNLLLWVDDFSTIEQSAGKDFLSKVVVHATLRTEKGYAKLSNGETFNTSLHNLAGENTVTAIEKTSIAPTSEDNYINVADEESLYPIYAWYKNQTIYLYTQTEKIYANKDSSGLFSEFADVTSLDLSYLDTTYTEYMLSMFYGMTNLTSLNIYDFNTPRLRGIDSMFADVSSLEELTFGPNFNTSNVETMNSVFSGMQSLKSLDLSMFNTSNVYVLDMTFTGCKSLTNLNVTSFDTSNFRATPWMFQGMTSIEVLDLSSFNLERDTYVKHMFSSCTNLKTIYVSEKWKISKLEIIFNGDVSLVGGAGTVYDSNHRDIEYARVDDPEHGRPGYLTLKTS